MSGGDSGFGAAEWIAVATSIYALATLSLAIVTSRASVRSARAIGDSTAQQASAAKDAAVIQARASSVSNNRQQWINQLRDEVTGLLTDAQIRDIVDNLLRLSEEREQQQLAIARSMRSHLNKVRLLINPTEGESTQLVTMLESVLARTDWSEQAEERIVAHTQKILKTEWERVKSGD